MRLLQTLFLSVLLVHAPALAFKAEEHESISTVGLWLALRSLADYEITTAVSNTFLECPSDSEEWQKECKKKVAQCIPFGLATAVVDKVFRPEGLLPLEGSHFARFGGDTAAKDFAHRCRRSYDSDKVQRFLEGRDRDEGERLNFAACRIRKKRRDFFNFLLAVHRNGSHFEACAAGNYNDLHGLAIDLAKRSRKSEDPRRWLDPLLVEAVALHFLQDSFAPGHLLTPRTAATDLISRGLHNRGNKSGAWAYLRNNESFASLLDLLVDESGEAESGGRPPAVEAYLESLKQAAEGLSRSSHSAGLVVDTKFRGDGWLLGKHRSERKDKLAKTQQAVIITLLSAMSIQEVFDAGLQEGGSSRLSIDFEPWSAQPKDGASDDIDKDTLRRPGFRFGDGQAEVAGFESKREKHKDSTRFSMKLSNHEIAAALLVGDSSQENGYRTEISLPFGGPSDGDIRRRTADGKLEVCKTWNDCTFSPAGNRIGLGVVVSWNLHFDEWTHYDAVGFTVRGLYPWRFGNSGWDVGVALEAGQKWYDGEGRNTSRFVWGGRTTFGLGVLFVEAGFERGSLLLPGGAQQRNTSYLLGLRVQLPF